MKLNSLVPVQQDAESRIQTFSEKIAELKSKYAGLAIADKEGYKLAAAAAKEIRQERLYLQRKAKIFTDDVKGLLNFFSGKSKALVAEFQTLETEIRTEIARVDAERREEKEREQREALEKFTKRTDLLFETGFVFDGYQYKIGTVFVVSGDVGDLIDDDFNALVEKGRKEAERMAKVITESVESFEVEHLPPADEQEKEADIEELADSFFGKLPDEYRVQPNGNPSTRPFEVFSIPEGGNFAGNGMPRQQAAEVLAEIKPDPSYRPAGYSAGFDACRNMVLEILNQDKKFTRAELKELIINLKM